MNASHAGLSRNAKAVMGLCENTIVGLRRVCVLRIRTSFTVRRVPSLGLRVLPTVAAAALVIAYDS